MPRLFHNAPESPRYVKKSQRFSGNTHLVHFQYHNPGHLQLRLLHCAEAQLMRWKHSNLSAPYWRLYIHSGPGALITMKQGKVPLSPNRVWLIAPDTPFGTELEAPVTQHFIHFTLAPIYACEPGLYSVEISAAMQSLLDMVQENNPKNKANEYTAENIVIARNAFVLLSLCGLPPGILHESRIDGRILRTIEHMERDISNIHTLDDLAKIAGMNPRALIRLFKQETGVTPMASLRARRIALACDMLHHTNRSIDEIATLTGFYDRYHFSKTFKNLREVTPTSFRHLR